MLFWVVLALIVGVFVGWNVQEPAWVKKAQDVVVNKVVGWFKR